MPRQKNTRPTHIYWLIDTRPETIAAGWLQGLPFYCGKTVRPIGRLKEHKTAAAKGGTRPVLHRVRECGDNLLLTTLEIVAADGDWAAREIHHIALLRRLNPDCVNLADGGQGAAGFAPNAQQRANIGAATRARCQCPEYRAKLSAAHKGQRMSLENRQRVALHFQAIRETEEYKIRNSEATKARWQNPEYRAQMVARATGRKLSAEAREKVASSKRGRPLSEKHKAKVGAFHRGKTISPQHRAALSAAHKGKSKSPEQRLKMSLAAKAWRAARREANQHA